MADALHLASAARAALPSFPGATLPEQLAAGQADAAARLRKYIGDFQFETKEASFVFHQVSAWMERHNQQLVALMMTPSAEQLPEQLKLELGVEKTKQFVVAAYSMATRTLGPWLSGTVSQKVYGGEVTEPRMLEDGQARLAVFCVIKRWDETGDLEMIFNPEKAGAQLMASMQGLGLHPVLVGAIIVAVAVVLIGGAAVICDYVKSLEVIERNADMMERWCEEARVRGDQETINKCLEMSTDLQKAALKETIDPVGTVIKYGAIVAGAYVVVAHGVPAILKQLRKGRD